MISLFLSCNGCGKEFAIENLTDDYGSTFDAMIRIAPLKAGWATLERLVSVPEFKAEVCRFFHYCPECSTTIPEIAEIKKSAQARAKGAIQ